MKKTLGIILLILVFLFSSWNLYQTGQLTITYLDVGQGDAALIRTPDDHLAVIDTGPDVFHSRAIK